MKILEINNVRKSFDELSVLKNISISVNEGEVISIIGPSGSGKSTLLRCATMLERMDGGELRYMGEAAAWNDESGNSVYAKRKDLKRIRGYFGLVFQNFNLFPHYTVLKNITDAPLHVQKRPKDEVMREAEGLLKKMGLEDKADYYPHQLSGGQQQRVAIARAIATKPPIIMADEPTGALDSSTSKEVMEVFRQLNAEGMTTVIVTHDPAVGAATHRIVRIVDGRIVDSDA